jgi:hypothetical protein
MRPGLTHDLWRTRKSASHSTESIIEDVNVANLHRNVTSHMRTLDRNNFRMARHPGEILKVTDHRGGQRFRSEPTHRLRMPALMTALPERARSGLHR